MKHRYIKKRITFFLFTFILGLMLVGCGNSAKVETLTNEIAELDKEIEEKSEELASWQEIYDEAYEIYHSPHSNDAEVQKELERTKEYMDEAYREKSALEREIPLLERQKDIKQKQLDDLEE